MKDKFPEYYPIEIEQEEALWKEATIVFDACSLLNLYSYSLETRDQVLLLLEKIKNRVWLPYQTGLEYHRNRASRISQECGHYKIQIERIENFKKDVGEAQKSIRKHPFLSKARLDALNEACDLALNELKEGREKHGKLIRTDQIKTKLTSIFQGKVGDAPTPEMLDNIFKEGRNRYKQKTPPGYEDEDKGDPAKFGDLLFWKETLEHAKKSQKPVILVTDDMKDDWWQKKQQGETIGPRAELLAEFTAYTGCQCMILATQSFLEKAKRRGLHEELTDQAIDEVKGIEKARQKVSLAKESELRRLAMLSSAKMDQVIESLSFNDKIRKDLVQSWVNQQMKEMQDGLQEKVNHAIDIESLMVPAFPFKLMPDIHDAPQNAEPDASGSESDKAPEKEDTPCGESDPKKGVDEGPGSSDTAQPPGGPVPEKDPDE